MFAGLSLKPSSKKFEPVAFELPSSIPTSKGVSSPPSDPVPAVPVTTHLSNDVSFEAPSSAFSFLSPSASDASIPQIPIATAAQSIPAETGFSFLGSSSAVHAPVSAQTPVPTHTIASGDHEDEDNHSEGSIGRSTIASEALEMGTMSPLRGFDSVERRFPISESKDASPSRVMEKSLKESSEHSVHSGHSNRSSTSADPGHLAAKLAITSQFAPTSSEKKKDKLGQLEEEVFNLERKIRSSMLELEQSLTKHWKNVESLNVEQKELQQRHADLEKQVRSLEHKVIDCEHQQQKFIDEEDFEKAEHLNVQLEDLRLKIEHCKSEQIRVIHARQTLEERRVKFTEESSNRIHDFISKIRDLQKENMRDHGSDIDDELRVVAEEEDVLVGALERAEEVLRHIESDLAQVEEQKSAIDQEIEAETEDVQQVKRAELERRTVLEFERDDLIQKLRAKESELEACAQRISLADSQIAESTKHFARDLRRIKEKKDNIIHDRSIREKDRDSIKAKQRELDQRKKMLLVREERFKELVASITGEIGNAEETVKRMNDYNSNWQKWISQESEFRSNIEQDLVKLSDLKSYMDSLSEKINNAESDIVSLESLISSIDIRLPQHQAEKQVAIKAKNFKDASRITQTMKDLEGEKLCHSDKIQFLQGEISECRKEQARVAVSIEEEEKLAKDAELSLQKHLLSICRDRVQHYQEILEHLENSSINHGAEKEVILGELSAVEKDVQFIVSTYGIDDQIPSREVSTSPKRSLSPKKAEASETQSPQDVAVKIEATRNEIMELQKKKIALDADLQQAIERDDFDEADDLQNQINQVELVISALVSKLEGLEKLGSSETFSKTEPENSHRLEEMERILSNSDIASPESEAEEKTDALQQLLSLENELESLKSLSVDLESRINSAVEADDFETADQLQSELNECNRKMYEIRLKIDELRPVLQQH